MAHKSPPTYVQSRDGTRIAFERSGKGTPLILVDGALCYRAFGPSAALAEILKERFTVFRYDRRGRGLSGDTAPYAVDREIEDIEALIREAGGSAFVFGVSSGAALALEAANCGLAITKLALFEAPFIVDDARTPMPDDFPTRLHDAVAEDRRADAVRLFMSLVQVPAFFVFIMPLMPAWSKLKGVAHTLPYDIAIVRERQHGKPLPAGSWDAVTVPTLVMDGGKSPAWMRNGMRALADVLPNAKLRTLPGQTHMVKPKVVGPVLTEFFEK